MKNANFNYCSTNFLRKIVINKVRKFLLNDNNITILLEVLEN